MLLVRLCVQALGPFASQLKGIKWTKIPLRREVAEDMIGLDVDSWTVLIQLFCDIPLPLCSFTTFILPKYSHGFLTILSLSSFNPSILTSTPNLTALDASSTLISFIPPLSHLRIIYLRNCPEFNTDCLLSLPLLSVIDLSGSPCSTPLPSFSSSSLSDLFQPCIQHSLSALASLYPDAFPSPLFSITHIPPKHTPRFSTQDSFVLFSSSSTKLGNIHTIDSHPRPRPRSHHTRTHSTLHLHRPPPPLPLPFSPSLSQPKPTTSTASVNLHNHKAQQARNGIDAFIKLRSTPSTPSLPVPLPTPSSSKNPFKKPNLKPISSFPPPILPPKKKLKISDPAKKSSSSFDWKAWSSRT